MIPDATDNQPESITGTLLMKRAAEPNDRSNRAAATTAHGSMGSTSLAKRVAQALLNGVFRVRGHHFTDIFEKEAKPDSRRPGSIRPGDKSPTNWIGIQRDSAANLSLEWIVDG